MILIADGSHWKTVNFQSLINADIHGLLWKATQGGSFVDSTYARTYDAAQLHDIDFMAMHYQDADYTDQQELDNIRRVVHPSIPLVLDVEDGSGKVDRTRWLHQKLIEYGYHIPFLYLPEWYWERPDVGKPDLSGLPPLWASHYVTGTGDPRQLFKKVPITWWNGYGNNNPMLLQYTSKGVLPGQTMGDYSIFNGDRAQFQRFLNRDNFDYTTDEDVMITAPAGQDTHVDLIVAGKRKLYIGCSLGQHVDITAIVAFPETNGGTPVWLFDGHGDGQDKPATETFTIDDGRPGPVVDLPGNAVSVSIRYSSELDFAVGAV